MIEESLLKTGILGKDGFVWWIGRVAAPRTWQDLNNAQSFDGNPGFRCKVRIIGYHPFDNTIKEDDLPWAICLMNPSDGSGMGGQGKTLGLKGGETCVGFFLDGEDGQQPVIMGLLHRPENITSSITPEEEKAYESSQFKNLPLYYGNNVPPNNKLPPQTTKINTNPANNTGVGASTCPATAIYPKEGKASCAAVNVYNDFCTPSEIPSNCQDSLIGGITQALQDFIAGISILETAVNGYINPVLNKVVDVTRKVEGTVTRIGGIIKMIINAIRKGIYKYLVKGFKAFLALLHKTDPTNPLTAQVQKKVVKTLLDQIFCIFEKLIDDIIKFISALLSNMIGKIINPTLCAAEQFVTAILAKLMELIENALQPVLSGVSWLTGGITSVTAILNQASSLASQIYSFIGDCGGLKCTQPSSWVFAAAIAVKKDTDNWKKQVEDVNFFKGVEKDLGQAEDFINKFGMPEDGMYNGYNVDSILGTVNSLTGGTGNLGSIEGAIAASTPFGSGSSPFDTCNQIASNPQTQQDLIPLPLGYQYATCIPPAAEVYGTGYGAQLIPVVGADSSILSVEVIDGGFGYQSPLTINIIDNSGYGYGAQAQAIVENGTITAAVVLSSGSGYCAGNYSGLGNTSFTAGISSAVVGVVTGFYIVSPGLGYTSGDKVSVGNTSFNPVITPNGSIISVNPPTNFSQTFSSIPSVVINTSTGDGAELVPIMKFAPQNVINSSATLTNNQNQVISVVDCPR